MNLRKAEIGDIERIREVADISYHSHYQDVLKEETIDKVIEDRYSEEELTEIIDSQDSLLIVVEENNDIVGFAYASWSENDAELESIYILPEYQGKGIGTKMLNLVIKQLPEQVKSIGVGAIKENEGAKNFYTSRGFDEKSEVVEDFYGEKAECQTFVKKLD